jgi:hypothetical protein
VPTPPFRRDDKKVDDTARKTVDAADAERKRVVAVRRQDEYLKKSREEGFVAIGLEQEKVLMLQTEDVTFPKNWKELSAKRTQVKMTDKEKKLINALNTPMTVDLQDSTLEDVIKYLQDKAGIPIIVPDVVLQDKGITYKVPVSVNLKNVTLRTILKKVLGDVGLVYVVDKETLQVTTEERASKTLTTRTYYVGDVFGLQAQRFGGIYNQLQMMTAVNDIIGVIVGTVEPRSWWLNGGEGTIAFDPRTMSLVVRQTAEIHFMLGGLGR